MKNIVTIILMLFTGAIFAQDIAFKKSNFKEDKDGLKLAVESIKNGDEFLQLGNQKVLLMTYACAAVCPSHWVVIWYVWRRKSVRNI